jgi:reactive intermediate/imine deaminase
MITDEGFVIKDEGSGIIARMRLLIACALLLIMQTAPSKQIINIGPAPVGPYSPAVVANGFIYVSGTLAQDKSGAIVEKGNITGQTRRVMDRMREVLEAAGTSLDRVVSVTVYLNSASDFQAMNEAYRTYWPKDPPTRTTVITDFVLPDALVEMSMIAVPPGAERAVVHPKAWIQSPNPYSYGIKTGDTLFLSGLVARNGRDNSVVAGDITAQTRAVMQNAQEILDAAGMTFANVVSSRVYLTDTANFQKMNEAYRTVFPSAPPARATVKSGLAGSQYLVEITMIASSSPRQQVGQSAPTLPLSAGIKAGQRVYLSGVLGSNPDTKGDVAAQTREVIARVRKTLDAAGARPEDVVDALVYLTKASDFQAMNNEYRTFFGKDFPARATVVTPLVAEDGLVEIMFTAAAR